MEKLLGIALRVVIVYVYLLVTVRLSGKRTIAEGTPFDLVVAFIVSDFPDDIIWGWVPVAQGITAITTVVLLHATVVFAMYHSDVLRRLIESEPSLFVEMGKPVRHNLSFEKINEFDLTAMLREHNISDMRDVQKARLEPSGQLSVERTPQAEYARKRDLNANA